MRKPEYWIISTFFAVGIIGGLSYLLLSGSDPVQRAELSPPLPASVEKELLRLEIDQPIHQYQTESRIESSPTDAAQRLIEEGDGMLNAYQITAAQSRYQAIPQMTGQLSDPLLLRLAICAELTQQPGKAARFYHRILEKKSIPTHRWLALSGLSRTWIERGNRSEALRLLFDLFLESLSEASRMPDEIAAQILFQTGAALQDITLQNYHYDVTRIDGVAFQTISPRIEDVFPLFDMEPNAEVSQPLDSTPLTAAASEMPEIQILQRPSLRIDLTILSIEAPLTPLPDLIGLLVKTCDMELHGSPRAKAALAGRIKRLSADAVQASLVLDALLLPLNLYWYQQDNTIQIFSVDDQGEQNSEFKRYFPIAMERFYRRLNIRFPGDLRSFIGLLSRSNLKFIQNDMNSAATHYQELLQMNPRGEDLAKVFFNIGKVELRLGRHQSAIRNFYLTIDQSYDWDLQSSCYWLIGQLNLEHRQLEDAVKTAGRSLSLAKSDRQKRLAALTMARAYLLANQPLSANRVLFDNQRVFIGTDGEATAAVLGSFSRYVAMTDPNNLDSERYRLLSAVAAAKDDQFENFLDIYLAGRAWMELGFFDQAIEKLKLAADSTSISAWRRQFLFELGVLLNQSNKMDESVAVFEFLFDNENDEWLVPSAKNLAQLYFTTKRFDDCISICLRILQFEISEPETQEFLTLMGRSYREIGKHHSATLCFAGIVPKTAALDD